MNEQTKVGKNLIILPTSAVMPFYYRLTGVVIDVIDCVDSSFYRVKFETNASIIKNMAMATGFEINTKSQFSGDLVGVFPVGANFLKFI